MAEQPPLPRMDLRTVGLAGIAAARAELDRARAVAIRARTQKESDEGTVASPTPGGP